ncbi:splicing factor [Tanacetum coccineum]
MRPILGMRYDHPEQLKLALANYGVAGEYQLWFQKNYWRQLLVYCGRDMSTGRCAGVYTSPSTLIGGDPRKNDPSGTWKEHTRKKAYTLEVHTKEAQRLLTHGCHAGNPCALQSNPTAQIDDPMIEEDGQAKMIGSVGKVKTRSCKVGEGTSNEGEGSSRNSDVSPKWTKSKIASSRKSGQPQCGFRLWASWMSTENSFQIKSLKAEHKCARNYNLGSLVTYKWIAHHFAKEIIKDPFMPLLKIKAAMREKFLINVSLGQCKRAKYRALYDFKGGLIEHYARLWEYRHAILDTNPGSTCILNDEETEYGNSYFRRFYICFKGVKYGWKAGCRRVIGLDGCFLKHTCRGELLTAIGKDANNQMYPITWALVKVKNFENCSWFISLLAEDLELSHGTGIRGLLDAVSDWLPNAEHKKCTRHVFANFKKKFSGV